MGRGRRVEGDGNPIPIGVRQLPSGKWQARLPKSLDPEGRPVPGGPWLTKEEAAGARAAMIRALEQGDARLPSTEPRDPDAPEEPVTVTDAVEALLRDHTDLSPKTVAGYKATLNTTIKQCKELPRRDWLGPKRLDQITPGTLHQWRRKMRAAGVSVNRQRLAWATVSSALSWEVEEGRRAENPALKVRLRRTSQGTSEATADAVRLPTFEEFHDLLTSVPRWEDRLMVALAGWCGPRFSEIAAIQKRSLRRATREVALTETWAKPTGQPWERRPLKTGEVRDIPVPAGLWNHLVWFVDEAWTEPAEGRLPLLFRPPVEEDGIHGPRGGVGIWTPSAFREGVWAEVRSATGTEYRVKDLRAYAASAIVSAGGSEVQAQQLLGHRNPQTTRKHYLRAERATAHDPARAGIRQDFTLSLPDRLTAVWDVWVDLFGDPLADRPEIGSN